MEQLINVLLPIVAGGFTGYITNIYAINMLFKEYTPFKIGGVIKKTKNEFIKNISELVERDIINHSTLEKELSKIEFEDNVKVLVNDLLSISIYENIGDINLNEIEGFDETILNTKNFIEKNLTPYIPSMMETVFENTFFSEIFSQNQITNLVSYMGDELIKIVEEQDVLNPLINILISQQGNQRLVDLIDEETLKNLQRNIYEEIEKIFDLGKEDKNLEVEACFTEILDEIDYKGIITGFQKAIFSKPLISIISSQNQEVLIDRFKYNMKIFLKSNEIETIFVGLIKELIEIGRKIDRPILDLISPKFRESVKDYLKAKLPLFIEKICIWIKDNSGDIEELIQEAIDETLDSKRGFRGELITLIKESFLGEIASKGDIADKIVDFLEDKLDIEELSEIITQKVIDYLEGKTIKSMIASLEKNQMMSPEKISSSVLDSIIMYIDLLPKEKYEKFFNQSLEKYLDIDFAKYFEERLKSKTVRFLKDEVIFKGLGKSYLNDKFEEKYKKIIHSPLKDILDNENINIVSRASQKKIINQLILKKDTIVSYISRRASLLAEDITINDVITENQKDEAAVLSNRKANELISRYIKSAEDKMVSSMIKSANNNAGIEQVLAEFAVGFTKNNLEYLLRGNVEKTVSKNLNKLDDDQISSLVHDFMGRELKPITYFGALLGGVFGLIPALMNQGNMILGFEFSLINISVFALVGLLTNVIALEMIFKPYEKSKILSKIPFLNRFSQGYIVKNRKSFGKNLANFVDNTLMDKEMIDNNLNQNYQKIRQRLFEDISKNNFERIGKVLEGNEESIANMISDFTFSYLISNEKSLSRQLTDLIKDMELKNIPVDNLIDSVDSYILNNKEFIKGKINDEISSFIYSDKNIKDIAWKNSEEYIKKAIKEEIVKQIDKALETLDKKELVYKMISDYESKYSSFIDKPIEDSFDKALIKNMENQVLKFIEKILISPKTKEKLMDFIHEKFNEELSPDKKVEDLLGGEFKFQIEKNLDKILESLENILIKALKENKEKIQRETKNFILGKLNFIQKSGYIFLGGDDIVDEIILKLVNQKFPKYISDSEEDIKTVLHTLLSEHIYSANLSEIKLRLSDSNVSSAVEDFLENEENLKVINGFIGKFTGSVMNQIISSPISRYLKTLSLTSLEDVYSRFECEINDLIENTIKELENSKEDISILSASLLYNLGEESTKYLTIKDICRGIEPQEIDSFTDIVLGKIIESEELKNSFINIFRDIYIKKYQETKVNDIISEDILYKDLRIKINDLLERSEVKEATKDILKDMIFLIKEDSAGFIDIKTKNQAIGILLDSILQSGARNIKDILKDIDFKNITEAKIEELNPKEIHELFNSFAGKYFTRLKLYGLGGGIFGFHFSIVALALIVHFIEQTREKNKTI